MTSTLRPSLSALAQRPSGGRARSSRRVGSQAVDFAQRSGRFGRRSYSSGPDPQGPPSGTVYGSPTLSVESVVGGRHHFGAARGCRLDSHRGHGRAVARRVVTAREARQAFGSARTGRPSTGSPALNGVGWRLGGSRRYRGFAAGSVGFRVWPDRARPGPQGGSWQVGLSPGRISM